MIGRDISKAKDLLSKGELVAIPTETVYGLAANAFNAEAVANIFEVKKRPTFDPLIVHTDELEKAGDFVEFIPEKAQLLAEEFWPGPLTLVMPKNEKIPNLVTSGLNTVGIRVPRHSSTLDLLKELRFPLAAPSANPFGYISPTRAQHVEDQLGDQVPYILDGGECAVGIESTIIGFEEETPIVYRMGGMSLEQIEGLIGDVKVSPSSSSNPKAPGMLDSHYSPRKTMLLGSIETLLTEYNKDEVSILSFTQVYDELDPEKQFVLSSKGDVHEAAKNLFDALRKLDKNDSKIILAELVPEEGLGRAINDRLTRASFKNDL